MTRRRARHVPPRRRRRGRRENLASDSGSSVTWVWCSPARSTQRRSERCRRSRSCWPIPWSADSSWASRRVSRSNASTDDVAAASTRAGASSTSEARSVSASRSAARATASTWPADTIAGGQRVVQFGHRGADRAALDDRFGVAGAAAPTAGQHRGGGPASCSARMARSASNASSHARICSEPATSSDEGCLIARRPIGCGQRGHRCDGIDAEHASIVSYVRSRVKRKSRKSQVRPVARRHPPPTSRASSTTAPQHRRKRHQPNTEASHDDEVELRPDEPTGTARGGAARAAPAGDRSRHRGRGSCRASP